MEDCSELVHLAKYFPLFFDLIFLQLNFAIDFLMMLSSDAAVFTVIAVRFWKVARLSYTPKMCSVLVHALEQMRDF